MLLPTMVDHGWQCFCQPWLTMVDNDVGSLNWLDCGGHWYKDRIILQISNSWQQPKRGFLNGTRATSRIKQFPGLNGWSKIWNVIDSGDGDKEVYHRLPGWVGNHFKWCWFFSSYIGINWSCSSLQIGFVKKKIQCFFFNVLEPLISRNTVISCKSKMATSEVRWRPLSWFVLEKFIAYFDVSWD